MNDTEFLRWIRDRLVHVYKESPNTDFVLRLDKIIERFDNLLTLEQGYKILFEETDEDRKREAQIRWEDKST